MTDSDNLYSMILRELYSPAWLRKSGRESYVELAKKLGVDDQTVRSVIGRMQKSGFLKTWSISLNPHALGMECESVIVETGKGTLSKDRIISQLKDVEGVVAIFCFLEDPGFRLVLYYEDNEDLERRTRLISSICDANKPSASWKIPFPPCRMALRKTDWQIVRFLLKDSRKTVSEISEGIGVSTRTSRRRLDVMTEDGSFFLTPVMDVKKVDGFLYHCVVLYDNKKAKAAIDKLFLRSIARVIFADTTAELYSVVAANCRNISESRQISDWLKAQDGVKTVTANILEDVIFVRGWIDHEIEKHLKS